MKRVGDTEESSKGTKKRKIDSSVDDLVEKVSMKYSEKMDLKQTFDLKLEKEQLVSKDGSKVLFLVITKNSKIKKQLDKIFKSLDNDYEQLLMVSKGDGIQKMITITEILKQKLKQLQTTEDKDVANNMIAKTENLDVIKVQGQIHDQKYEYNYNQLNFLDSTIKEKNIFHESVEIEGTYDKNILNEELKVKKSVNSPVLYIYMTFHSNEKNPDNINRKLNSLVSTGWSLQKC